MSEIKHTFTGGKMNKDLDERFVRNGEYRDAMNIQVRTTDGDSAGTAQNLQGNTSVAQTHFHEWMAGSSDYTISGAGTSPNFPICVASVTDEKNDKAYFFFSGGDPITDTTQLTTHNNTKYFVDTIIEKDVNTGGQGPVIVDKWAILEPVTNVFPSDLYGFDDDGSLDNQSDNTFDSGEFRLITYED